MNPNSRYTQLTPINFSEAKKLIQPGDFLLCSGNGLMSDIIKSGTDSLFSHIGLILFEPVSEDWIVLESVESVGVRCVNLLNTYLKNYNGSNQPYPGKVYIARYQNMPGNLKNLLPLKPLYQKAFSLLGDEYNQTDILRIAKRISEHAIGINPNGDLLPGNKYICSEFVYTCCKAINIDLSFDKLGFIAPGDIGSNVKVEPVAALKI